MPALAKVPLVLIDSAEIANDRCALDHIWEGILKHILKWTGVAAFVVCGTIASADSGDYEHSEEAQEYIHGSPIVESEAWLLAAGGRIYDKWWLALDRDEPAGTNPAYPTDVNQKQSGPGTWRCKECHGWDYRGEDGIYSSGSHFSGIPGIDGAVGRPVEQISRTLRDENHPYTPEMITDQEMLRVAAFVSRGQVDMRTFLNIESRSMLGGVGDPIRGREIFQTTCAACHGFDGAAMDWGDEDGPAYIGTEAADLPDEVFHKLFSGHPGVAMINLRAFSLQDAIDTLTYAATLPVE